MEQSADFLRYKRNYKQSQKAALLQQAQQMHEVTPQEIPQSSVRPIPVPILHENVAILETSHNSWYYQTISRNVTVADEPRLNFSPLGPDFKALSHPQIAVGSSSEANFKYIHLLDPNEGGDYSRIYLINELKRAALYAKHQGREQELLNIIRRKLGDSLANAMLPSSPADETHNPADYFCAQWVQYCCTRHYAFTADAESASETEPTISHFPAHPINTGEQLKEYAENQSLQVAYEYQCDNQYQCHRWQVPIDDAELDDHEKRIIEKELWSRNSWYISFVTQIECWKIQQHLNSQNISASPPTYPKVDASQHDVPQDLEIHQVMGQYWSCHGECTTQTCDCFTGIGKELEGAEEPRNCCMKRCRCSASCPKRFLGCECHKWGLKCNTEQCVCWNNNIECDPDICCKEPCDNMNMLPRKRKRTGLSKSRVKEAGFGLFALQDFQKDEYVMEYTGEVITLSESLRRTALLVRYGLTYQETISCRQSLDAYRRGNKARFINHRSSKPNCQAIPKHVDGEARIGIYTLKNIKKGQELFMNYDLDITDNTFYPWHQVNKRSNARSRRKS